MSKKLSRQEKLFRKIRRLGDVQITVQEPCNVVWNRMEGNDQFVRRCPFCQLNVYSFLGLNSDEILALINQHEGKLCAQFYVRSDRTMTAEQCDRADDEDDWQPYERGGLFLSARADYLLTILMEPCFSFAHQLPKYAKVLNDRESIH